MKTEIYHIENLDCANCAAKIEKKFNDHPQVEEAVITFATMQLRLRAEDPDGLLPTLQEIGRSVEPDFVLSHRKEGGHHDHTRECDCGHHHDHGQECGCEHHHGHGHDHEHKHEQRPAEKRKERREILWGAGLFLTGLILNGLKLGLPSMVAFAGAYIILGWDILTKACKNLVNGHVLDENFLMGVASLGAFCIGEGAEGVGVMLFYRVGEYFEDVAMERSRSQIMKTVDLRPETVNLLEGESVRVIPADRAQVGDLLLIRPGDRIPLDGVVISGESRIDTAPITGEPVPLRATAGNSVISGCVNGSGQLVIRADKPLSESMVTRILNSVENAAANKPKIDRFITRFARIYTPVVVGAAAFIGVVPSLITQNWNYWIYTALSFLVMSCPCALVLSVPLAFFAGIGAGSKKGILFKGGISMEAMSGIKAVIMDKTGTLTRGDFRVQQIAGGENVLRLCASCEQHSTHPIAQSITAAAKERELELQKATDLEEIPGQGIRAMIAGSRVLCGNARLLTEAGVSFAEVGDAPGTIVYVAVDGRFAGYLVIADTIKPGAGSAIGELKENGIFTVMLTGDNTATAGAVAAELGIEEVHARLLPHQKLEQLERVRREKGAVMFVGDGINDAPVLAGADVGAAMGSGADAAIEAADVVYMTSDAKAIPESLKIARQTNRIAWQNVVFALGIKAAVMLLGLLGHASMWMAVFADSGVAMLCVLNSIRTLYRKGSGN